MPAYGHRLVALRGRPRGFVRKLGDVHSSLGSTAESRRLAEVVSLALKVTDTPIEFVPMLNSVAVEGLSTRPAQFCIVLLGGIQTLPAMSSFTWLCTSLPLHDKHAALDKLAHF